MIKKSSAYKKVVCSISMCMLLQATAPTIPFLRSTVFASSPITASLESTATNHTTPANISFPGSIHPGEANATVNENNFKLFNKALNVDFVKNGNSFKISSIENKLTKETYNITMNKLFDLTLSNDTHISASDMTIKTPPKLIDLTATSKGIRLSDRDFGKKIETVFEYNKNGVHFELTWNVILRNNSNNIRQEFTYKAIDNAVNIKDYKLFDLNIENQNLTKVNNDDGSPVTANNIFMGLESPLAKINVQDTSLSINIGSMNELTTDKTRTFTTGIGVSPENQMKRSFRYYLERERVHFRRPLLMYNSWWTFINNDYDQNHPNLEPGETVQPTEQELTDYINMYGNNLGSRGVTVDSYQIDDGWDNIDANPVWSFNHNSLPNEFKNLKETAHNHNGQLGVWMSPFGGYSGRNHRTGANPELGAVGGKFKLSNENYYKVFKDRVFNMMDEQGVTSFKFDGVGVGLRVSGPGNNPETLKEYENLLDLLIKMREHKPDVFIYCTVGSWASPYWLWYCDSVWRDEEDQGISGEGTGRQEEIATAEDGYKWDKVGNRFSDREQWINYRDNSIRIHNVNENPYMTINELMTHGVAFSAHSNYIFNNDLNKQYVKDSLLHDMKMLFALGGSLQELHIQKDQVDRLSEENQNFLWDNLAKNIKWSQDNFALLSDNQWVGGSPNKGEVYGFASWSKEKVILSLRNPSNSEKTFTIDPQKVFNIPEGEGKTYLFTERDGIKIPFEVTAGKPVNIKLKPFDVLILEGKPEAEPTRTYETSEKTETITEEVIPQNTLTAETTSTYKTDVAANLLDGDTETIWESNYDSRLGTVGRIPQSITITLDTPTEVNKFQYVPRKQAPQANGTITEYRLEVSTDGSNFTQVKTGTLANDNTAKNIVIDNPQTIKAIKFTGLDSANFYGSDKLASGAEINLFKEINEERTTTILPIVGDTPQTYLPGAIEKQVEANKAKIAELQKLLDAAKAQLESATTELESAKEETAKLKEDTKKQIDTLTTQTEELRNDLDESTNQLNEAKEDLANANKEIETLKNTIEELNNRVTEVEKQTNEVKEETENQGNENGQTNQESQVENAIRLGGQTRFDTATSIANKMYSDKVSNIVVTNAFAFADQITSSVIANKNDAPVLLVGTNKEDNTKTLDYIKSHMTEDTKVTIVGGTGVVTTETEDSIKSLGIKNIERLAGDDRYKSNLETVKNLNVSKGSPIIVASGTGFADALSVMSIAGMDKTPIILAPESGLTKEASEYIKSIAPSKILAIGGEGVISNSTFNALKELSSSVTRLGGQDRYETNLQVLNHFNVEGSKIAIASGTDFPDSLVGSVYAAKEKAPIMLVKNGMNTEKQNQLIDAHKYNNLIVFGGEGVVSSDLLKNLTK
ncbi:cell wall-binding repeat-containing protein [Clostridium oceanicum]|uniref:F5/8 type C domain-containing protein n=1 Tax=Clostridium oceanicum TaxID=1543 RepID=A0ABN1JB54_9CLOT